jgi:hypothetical protein
MKSSVSERADGLVFALSRDELECSPELARPEPA